MTAVLFVLLVSAIVALVINFLCLLFLGREVSDLRAEQQSDRAWADEYFNRWCKADDELNRLRRDYASQQEVKP